MELFDLENRIDGFEIETRMMIERIKRRRKFTHLCKRAGINYMTLTSWMEYKGNDLGLKQIRRILKEATLLLDETD